jgi:hypothetical protein
MSITPDINTPAIFCDSDGLPLYRFALWDKLLIPSSSLLRCDSDGIALQYYKEFIVNKIIAYVSILENTWKTTRSKSISV